MWMPLLAVLAGLAILVWSADKFIDGAAAVARHFSLPPLLIGVVIVGFGTSAPEMAVSVLSAMEGSPGIALGNAYGSNIANIALILGLTALISPIVVQSSILRKELPILAGITALSVGLVWDLDIGRTDAWILLGVFGLLLAWSVREGLRSGPDALGTETEAELDAHPLAIGKAWFWLAAGLLLLVASSRLLVWGAVTIAQSLGVSDLVIGLTVVAVGTSLPELASCVAAARKNEHDLALGNVLGSNLFNTLAVVGLAGAIQPMAVESAVLTRDMAVMGALTLALFVLGYGHQGQPGRINRWEGALLVLTFAGYTAWLLYTTLGTPA
ncbi:calcium/sodium antiporter [Aquabacterium sp. A08]|uniref:calcium/sodium antiporter n=1 Tax=Aquabacterium sp. A08 TaxID=2718532 RepID=UPI001421600A|nr:calcium/sodium antiporter [Aquabacterium sp. A08]NIC41518.1 calcium/sodium antiporter [Aquabacterium sp. A08]NIC42042.1 calcium/sodium antiporter [Aquabacterium sp. A08]NIC42091.1 calcium/sodium antiporter [Aquabacterium sp. A08]